MLKSLTNQKRYRSSHSPLPEWSNYRKGFIIFLFFSSLFDKDIFLQKKVFHISLNIIKFLEKIESIQEVVSLQLEQVFDEGKEIKAALEKLLLTSFKQADVLLSVQRQLNDLQSNFLKSSFSRRTLVSDYKEEAVVEESPNEGPVLEVGDLGGSGLKASLAAFFETEKISEADVAKGTEYTEVSPARGGSQKTMNFGGPEILPSKSQRIIWKRNLCLNLHQVLGKEAAAVRRFDLIWLQHVKLPWD